MRLWRVEITVKDPDGEAKLTQTCVYEKAADAFGAANEAFQAAAEPVYGAGFSIERRQL